MSENSAVDEVERICAELNNESIFHLSLHSKELFHSNVIAWFCETYPLEAGRVLARWVSKRETTIHRVQRERGNLDLAIEIPGLAPVVIENKVFSPPDDNQLDRYSEGELAGFLEPELVLLSLGAPTWDESIYISSSGSVWKYVSYRDLVSAIQDEVQMIAGFDGDLLRKYVKFVLLLQDLVDVVGNPGPDDPIEVDEESNLILKSVRLHDAIGKLRARSAIAAVARSIAVKGDLGEVAFHANFTNSQPLMEAFISCSNGDQIGWQLQGQQWRLAIKTAVYVGETSELRDMRYDHAKQIYGDWFDFSEIPELIGRSVSINSNLEKKGSYNGYKPDFVYRYRKLKGLTLNDLEILSHHYLHQARIWI